MPLVAAAESTPLVPAAATASLGTAASAAVGLPPLSPDALSAAIAGLPDVEAGGALVQVRGAAGAWSGSSGISSVRAPRPPALDGRFRIGSMTKVFTAIVTLQLAAERRLDLDVPIQR
jgi:D-alanyl-D-alanine carboxypeptidase